MASSVVARTVGTVKRQALTKILPFIVIAAALANDSTRSLALCIGVLLAMVSIHELGHLLAARACGVDAPEYSVGFGPEIIGTKKDRRTRYVLRMIPLGGYVRIRGLGVSSKLEGETDTSRPVQGLGYDEVSHAKRAFISFAGPFANILTAFMILLAVFQSVGRVDSTLVVTPTPGLPAYEAGLRDNDTLVSINGYQLKSWEEVGPLIDKQRAPGEQITVTARTQSGALKSVVVTPVMKDGDPRIGVQAQTTRSSVSIAVAAKNAALATGSITKTTFASFGQLGHAFVSMPAQLIGEDTSTNRMVSPVGAARLAESSARNDGWLGPVTLIASISVFIALFNLLPLPPLDGSHIMTALYEGVMSRVRRRSVKVDPTFMNRLAAVTMAFVLAIGVGSLLLDILHPIAIP